MSRKRPQPHKPSGPRASRPPHCGAGVLPAKKPCGAGTLPAKKPCGAGILPAKASGLASGTGVPPVDPPKSDNATLHAIFLSVPEWRAIAALLRLIEQDTGRGIAQYFADEIDDQLNYRNESAAL